MNVVELDPGAFIVYSLVSLGRSQAPPSRVG